MKEGSVFSCGRLQAVAVSRERCRGHPRRRLRLLPGCPVQQPSGSHPCPQAQPPSTPVLALRPVWRQQRGGKARLWAEGMAYSGMQPDKPKLGPGLVLSAGLAAGWSAGARGCAGGRLCLLVILGFLGKNCQSWALPVPPTPPAPGWLQGQVQGGRPQFVLSDPLCPRVSDLNGLNLQIILHSPSNNFLSQLQPCGWFSPRAPCLFFWASLSVISLVTCDMTLP